MGFMSLPGKVEKAISIDQQRLEIIKDMRTHAHDELLREIGQQRTEVGTVNELIGNDFRRAGGLHDLINRMEEISGIHGRGFADKEHPLARKFKQLHEVVDRYF